MIIRTCGKKAGSALTTEEVTQLDAGVWNPKKRELEE